MIKFVFRMILSHFGVGRWVESYKTNGEEEEEAEEEQPSFSKTFITKQYPTHEKKKEQIKREKK